MLHTSKDEPEEEFRKRLKVPARNPDQLLYVSDPLPQTSRVMVKDEDLCVHCGLCAERCPTDAWDMQKSKLLVPYARDELEGSDTWHTHAAE
jgi:NAD-dependent dihydropyrimidine dehydrogenase PreA subunit